MVILRFRLGKILIRNELIIILRADHVNKITISARKWPEKWGFYDSKTENVNSLFVIKILSI